MASILFTLFLALLSQAVGAPCTKRSSSYSNANTSLTLLYQNNLNITDDVNHIGAILLDATMAFSAAAACEEIGESLLSVAALQAHASDFYYQFTYLTYTGRADTSGRYIIENGTVSAGNSEGQLAFQAEAPTLLPLPVLCTQSSTENQADSVVTAGNQISIPAGGNTYVGFRNQKSFRFQGIRYAPQPSRFEYSVPYAPTGLVINATQYGSQCMQPYSGGSEDCLFLNIQTPYIPKAGSTENLRPVMFWIHGGGFTGGAGSTSNSDGGQLASREDVVVVSINYRLSTLGFLAVPGTDVTGNYGIADQNLALEWVIKNIASFGGDPKQITINGASAGACSVRVHLGSPKSIGKFQGALAQSNLGGGIDLGLGGDYATQYSSYVTIEGSYELSSALFSEAGCNQTDLNAAIACLKTVDASTLVSLNTVARYVVQDGIYINTPELEVSHPSANTAHVPVIFGIARDDGASFSTYPRPPVTSELAGIEAALGISASWAQAVISSGLFPYPNTGNVTLDSFNVSARIATDNQFRCIDQASAFAGATSGVFPAVWFYESDRTGFGYDPNNLGGPPVEPGYPNGDPNLPYFRVHGSDQDESFAWLFNLRDADDLWNVQMTSAHYGSFFRVGTPNPPEAYLRARGYDKVIQGVAESGGWDAVRGIDGPIRHHDWPGFLSDFVDKPQCAWLNYSIEYYLAK